MAFDMDINSIQNQVVGTLIAAAILWLIRLLSSPKAPARKPEEAVAPVKPSANETEKFIVGTTRKSVPRRIINWLFKFMFKLMLSVTLATVACVYLDYALSSREPLSDNTLITLYGATYVLVFIIAWRMSPFRPFTRTNKYETRS